MNNESGGLTVESDAGNSGRASTIERRLMLIAVCAWLVILSVATWSSGLVDDQVMSHGIRVGLVCVVAGAICFLGFVFPPGRPQVLLLTLSVLVFISITAYFVTPQLLLTAAAIAVFSTLVGRLLVRDADIPSETTMIVGMAAISAIVGWLLPYPLHTVRVYFAASVIFAAISLFIRPVNPRSWKLRELSVERGEMWRPVLVLAGIGLASMGLWLPTLNYDDNAGHLIMVSQVLDDAYYHLDVSTQVWALAPWANNVLHTVAAVVAGIEARPSVNFLWLLLGAAAAYRLAMTLSGDKGTSALATVAYLSQPLVAYFTTTMQVDGATAGVFMILLTQVVQRGEKTADAIILGALFGLLAGLKSSNVVFAAIPLLCVLYRDVRGRKYGQLICMLLTAGLVAGSSYFYAYLVTGNPFFPLFNAVFKSSYMEPVNFIDRRWHPGLSVLSLWDLTLHTGKYGEHYAGAAGIAFIAFAVAAIPKTIRDSKFRLVFIAALTGGSLMFWQVQYLRYVFPALSVLTILGVIGLRDYMSRPTHAFVLIVVSAFNFSLMPTTSWILHSDAWTELLAGGREKRAAIEANVMPVKTALSKIIQEAPGACVLVADENAPFIGAVSDRAFATAWYDKRLAAARAEAQADHSGRIWASLVRTLGVSHVLVAGSGDVSLYAGLRSIGYRAVDKVGYLEVWANPRPRDRICDSKIKKYRDESVRYLRFNEEAK